MIVVEARDKQGEVPKVVDRWGDPDSSKCVLAASFDDSRSNPVLVFFFSFFNKMRTFKFSVLVLNMFLL